MVFLAAHPIKSGLNLPGSFQTSSPFRRQTPCSGYPHSPHDYIVTEKIPFTINPRLIHGILKQVKSFRQNTSLCELQADRQWKTCCQLYASFLFAAATWSWSISTRPSVPAVSAKRWMIVSSGSCGGMRSTGLARCRIRPNIELKRGGHLLYWCPPLLLPFISYLHQARQNPAIYFCLAQSNTLLKVQIPTIGF